MNCIHEDDHHCCFVVSCVKCNTEPPCCWSRGWSLGGVSRGWSSSKERRPKPRHHAPLPHGNNMTTTCEQIDKRRVEDYSATFCGDMGRRQQNTLSSYIACRCDEGWYQHDVCLIVRRMIIDWLINSMEHYCQASQWCFRCDLLQIALLFVAYKQLKHEGMIVWCARIDNNLSLWARIIVKLDRHPPWGEQPRMLPLCRACDSRSNACFIIVVAQEFDAGRRQEGPWRVFGNACFFQETKTECWLWLTHHTTTHILLIWCWWVHDSPLCEF